jgi:Ca2+/H+ antiporter
MKFLWSVMLLFSVIFAMAVPMFFGHALVSGEHGRDTRFFLYAAVCLAIAATLFFVQVRMRPDRDPTHH